MQRRRERGRIWIWRGNENGVCRWTLDLYCVYLKGMDVNGMEVKEGGRSNLGWNMRSWGARAEKEI
jgi:hypothetical protein